MEENQTSYPVSVEVDLTARNRHEAEKIAADLGRVMYGEDSGIESVTVRVDRATVAEFRHVKSRS